ERLGDWQDGWAYGGISCAHRRVDRRRAALAGSAAPAAGLQAAHALRLERRRALLRRRHLLAVLPADAVHAAGAALLRAPDRSGLPHVRALDRRLLRRVASGGDEDRHPPRPANRAA